MDHTIIIACIIVKMGKLIGQDGSYNCLYCFEGEGYDENLILFGGWDGSYNCLYCFEGEGYDGKLILFGITQLLAYADSLWRLGWIINCLPYFEGKDCDDELILF